MAGKKQPIKIEPQKVYCGECKYFHRDTEGVSKTVDGEYFMGVCLKGLTPDTVRKQFADKPRSCNEYKPAIKTFDVKTPDGGSIANTVNMRLTINT